MKPISVYAHLKQPILTFMLYRITFSGAHSRRITFTLHEMYEVKRSRWYQLSIRDRFGSQECGYRAVGSCANIRGLLLGVSLAKFHLSVERHCCGRIKI